MYRIGIFLAAALALSAQRAGNADSAGRWKAIQFLLGDWTAKGEGATGPAGGAYSFKPELNNQIVVRHSYAEYGSAGKDRHDDLLIVYADAHGRPMRAIYFDSEGHVINYGVKLSAPDSVTFESDTAQPGPKYRLSYRLTGKNLSGKFEASPPGSAQYKTYLAWTSVRK